MAPEEVLKAKSQLDIDMFERRKKLNAEHYYPRLKEIQKQCSHPRKGYKSHFNIFGEERFSCGYCDKGIKK